MSWKPSLIKPSIHQAPPRSPVSSVPGSGQAAGSSAKLYRFALRQLEVRLSSPYQRLHSSNQDMWHNPSATYISTGYRASFPEVPTRRTASTWHRHTVKARICVNVVLEAMHDSHVCLKALRRFIDSYSLQSALQGSTSIALRVVYGLRPGPRIHLLINLDHMLKASTKGSETTAHRRLKPSFSRRSRGRVEGAMQSLLITSDCPRSHSGTN